MVYTLCHVCQCVNCSTYRYVVDSICINIVFNTSKVYSIYGLNTTTRIYNMLDIAHILYIVYMTCVPMKF